MIPVAPTGADAHTNDRGCAPRSRPRLQGHDEGQPLPAAMVSGAGRVPVCQPGRPNNRSRAAAQDAGALAGLGSAINADLARMEAETASAFDLGMAAGCRLLEAQALLPARGAYESWAKSAIAASRAWRHVLTSAARAAMFLGPARAWAAEHHIKGKDDLRGASALVDRWRAAHGVPRAAKARRVAKVELGETRDGAPSPSPEDLAAALAAAEARLADCAEAIAEVTFKNRRLSRACADLQAMAIELAERLACGRALDAGMLKRLRALTLDGDEA